MKAELGLGDSMRPREAIVQACDVLGIDAAGEISQGHGLKALAVRLAQELGILHNHTPRSSKNSGSKFDGSGLVKAGSTATRIEEEASFVKPGAREHIREQPGGNAPVRIIVNGTRTVSFSGFEVEDDSLRLDGLEMTANPAWQQSSAASGRFSTCVATWAESNRLKCADSASVQTGDLVVAVAGVSTAGVDHGSLLRLISTAERPINLTFCSTEFIDQIAQEKRLRASTDMHTQDYQARAASPSRPAVRSPRRPRSVAAARRHQSPTSSVHERLADWRSFTVSAPQTAQSAPLRVAWQSSVITPKSRSCVCFCQGTHRVGMVNVHRTASGNPSGAHGLAAMLRKPDIDATPTMMRTVSPELSMHSSAGNAVALRE